MEWIRDEKFKACGTRGVLRVADGRELFRVCCATCETAGGEIFERRELATAAAVRQSGRRCPNCGAD